MKKILSLILALSLIISAAPMSFAADSDEAVDEPGMHFNFNAAGYGLETDIGYDTLESYDDRTGSESQTATWSSAAGDKWRIDGACYTYEEDGFFLTDGDGYTSGDDFYQPNALSFKAKGSNTLDSRYYNKALGYVIVAIAINANETGAFVPSLTYHVGAGLPKCDVYLAKRKDSYITSNNRKVMGFNSCTNYALMQYQVVANNIAKKSDTKLGTIDMYAAQEGTRTTEFTPYEIPEGQTGEYVLFLQMSNVNEEVYEACEKEPTKFSDYVTSIHSFDLTPVPAKDLADKAFTASVDEDNPPVNSASIAAYTVCGTEAPESLTAPDVTYGETCELEAPLTKIGEDGKTYNFLYWARGLNASALNKKVVSDKNKFTYRPFEGVNYLIAVYEAEDASKVEFYNGNGELMKDVELDDGNLPALPSMAGYGESTGWKIHQKDGKGKVYAAGEAAPTEGTRIFVAQYDDPADDIAITVEGGEGSGNYAYGDPVTCVSNDANFSYWEKTINGKKQIVSIDKTYTFNAWETCTVTAVCNGSVSETDLGRVARKIIFGTFTVGNLTAVMAEFIGFEGAKEKGIMFDNRKIAMTTDYAQFTVTNDTSAAATVTGYAIVDDEKYVDGSISVAGVPAE